MVYLDLAQVDACGARRVDLDEDPQAQTRTSYRFPWEAWALGEAWQHEFKRAKKWRSSASFQNHIFPLWS